MHIDFQKITKHIQKKKKKMIDNKKLWRISSSLTFIQGFVKNKRRKNKDR